MPPRNESPNGARSPLIARLAVCGLVALAGCNVAGEPGVAPETQTRVVADGLGRSIRVPIHPGRIVSLAPNVTEALLDLGLGDRLAGVTDFCRLPPGSPPVTRIGGMLDPNLETIRALRPDLLIGSTSGNDPGFSAQAAALGVPFYALHTPDVASVLSGLRSLAAALGEPESGARLEAALRKRLEAVAERVESRPRPRVLFVVWGDPLVVPGRTAFLTDALRMAGGASITADAPAAWPAFDVELAIARAPDVILTTIDSRSTVERLARDSAWRHVPAIRRHRVYVVGDAIEQPGPRVIEGIEAVARLLHPEAFAGGGEPGSSSGEIPAGATRR